MANAEKKEEQEEQNEDQKDKSESGNSVVKIIVIVVIGLLLIGGTVGATLFFLGVFSDEVEEENVGQEISDEPDKPSLPPAIYYPIKPAFIVNFQVRGRQRLLQIAVTVMTREADAVDAVQTHLPLIKNSLVMLFSGELYEDLQTAEGRELLRQKTLMAIQDILQEEIGKPGVEQVLFEDFIMQ